MNFVLLLLGIITGAVFIILYFSGRKKYGQMADNVDGSVYLIPDIFVVGISVVQMLKINTAKKDMKLRIKLTELFGKRYVEFYCLIGTASTISYIMLLLPVAFFLGAMTSSAAMTLVIIVVSALLPVYVNMNIDTKIKEQREEVLLDYPNILSKMALLINAGMLLREAWQTAGESGDRKMYREMQNVTLMIKNGYSEIEAYNELSDACKLNEIKKFVSIICQSTERAGSELVHILKELSVDAWNSKKNVAKMRGDAASGKLIIPIGITFVGILIMIMVPIVANMNLGM